jgi:hypothetical protein
MHVQAKEILKAVDELYTLYPKSEDEGVEAMRVIILEKRLESIFGKEKYYGVSVRELADGTLQLVHNQAHLTCQKTAGNAVNIKITPYNHDNELVKHSE